jgi:hypothetical protein
VALQQAALITINDTVDSEGCMPALCPRVREIARRVPLEHPYSTPRLPLDTPTGPPGTPRLPLDYPESTRATANGAPVPFARLVCAQRPWPRACTGCFFSGRDCRNTALHVAASSKRANRRTAMVAFLIAERADVSKANKQGCAAQQRARRPRPRRVVPSWSALRRRLAIVDRY